MSTSKLASDIANAASVTNVIANARAVAKIDKQAPAVLADFAAIFNNLDVPTYKAKRAEWVAAYDAAHGSERGAKRFSEVVAAAGVVKPRTASAAAKQAKRKAEAAKAPAKVDARSKAARAEKATAQAVAEVKSGKGEAAARTIKMELAAMEAHLIGLIRAKKFAQAAQCVADMASNA